MAVEARSSDRLGEENISIVGRWFELRLSRFRAVKPRGSSLQCMATHFDNRTSGRFTGQGLTEDVAHGEKYRNYGRHLKNSALVFAMAALRIPVLPRMRAGRHLIVAEKAIIKGKRWHDGQNALIATDRRGLRRFRPFRIGPLALDWRT